MPPPSPLADLTDQTEYQFDSPSTGRTVLADFSGESLAGRSLDEFIETKIDRTRDSLDARIRDSHTVSSPVGMVTVLHFDLPGDAEAPEGFEQRTALIPLISGNVGNLTLLSRIDDLGAEAEFERLLASLDRPAQPPEGLDAVRLSMVSERRDKSPFPIGELTLQLSADYARPREFLLHAPETGLFHLSLNTTDDAVQPAALGGAIQIARRDEWGRVERFAATPDLWAQRPSAPAPVAATAEPAASGGRKKGRAAKAAAAEPRVVEHELKDIGRLRVSAGTDSKLAQALAHSLRSQLTSS